MNPAPRPTFIDPRFFGKHPVRLGHGHRGLCLAAWAGSLFMMSLYLQVRGYSAMDTGLVCPPIAIGALFFLPLSGRLVGPTAAGHRC